MTSPGASARPPALLSPERRPSDRGAAERRLFERRSAAFDAASPRRAPPAADHHRRALVVAAAMLSALTLTAAAGAYWVFAPDVVERREMIARMGGPINLAQLPTVRMEMGGEGALTLDLTLALELEPGVGATAIDPYVDRFLDRMSDRLRDAGLERLQGAQGALLVKEAARALAQQEFRKLGVRDVLIKEMLVRTPYSATYVPGAAPV